MQGSVAMTGNAAASLEMIGVRGLPMVQPGDDLPRLVGDSLIARGMSLWPGDVLVIAQKVVSKSEGRRVDLAHVTPSERARQLAEVVDKDPRLVELILGESVRVVRCRRDVLIVEHRLGFIMANAGIDQSNVAAEADGDFALLLPLDPDASAARLREALESRFQLPLAVVVNDSFGRPWRRGSVGVALGCSGLPALLDLRGKPDLFGRRLRVTEVGLADEVAAAASLLMGQSDEGVPVVVVRGLNVCGAPTPARTLVRAAETDLFR